MPTTSIPTSLEIADRLFTAVATADIAAVERLYAPQCVVWHNFDGIEQTVAENLQTLRWLTRNVANLRYEEVQRHETLTGFVQQHVIRGDDRAGRPIEVPACMVGTVIDGRITRLDEYLDSAHVESLLPSP